MHEKSFSTTDEFSQHIKCMPSSRYHRTRLRPSYASINEGRKPYDPAVCYLLRKPASHRKTLRLSTTKILKRSQVRIKELLSRPFATISLSLPRLHLQLLVVVKPQRHCRAAWQEKATSPPTKTPRQDFGPAKVEDTSTQPLQT